MKMLIDFNKTYCTADGRVVSSIHTDPEYRDAKFPLLVTFEGGGGYIRLYNFEGEPMPPASAEDFLFEDIGTANMRGKLITQKQLHEAVEVAHQTEVGLLEQRIEQLEKLLKRSPKEVWIRETALKILLSGVGGDVGPAGCLSRANALWDMEYVR